MSDTKWREWVLTSENLVHKVEGPGYSSSDRIQVIEIGALDELKAENEKLTEELELQKLKANSRNEYTASLEQEVQRLEDKLHVEELKDREASAGKDGVK